MNFQARSRNLAPLRSQLTRWHELSEIEQQSLSGGFNTEGDVDRAIIVGSIRSGNDGTINNTTSHEVGHAHGREHSFVTKAIEIIFDTIQ
jgi:hypothetical protein